MYSVTKTYQDLPAAHRQPFHDGHCRLIHGHNWRFDITFTCDDLDTNGFVIDVGKLGKVKDFLTEHFDHTLLLNREDHGIPIGGEEEGWIEEFAKIVRVPNCGMEGLALFVFANVQSMMGGGPRGLKVTEVTCWEDSKNRATYRPS